VWRSWLALTLSLAAHGLFALVLALLPARPALQAGGPVPVDAVVLDVPAGRLTFEGPSPGPRRGKADSTAEPEEAPFTATVVEAPVVAAPPSESGYRPQVVAGGSTSGGDVGAARDGPGASLFAAGGSARKIVYVIDRSLSMGVSGALDAARRELLAGLEALPPDAEFQVIFYARDAEPLDLGGGTGLLPATPENRRAVAELLPAIRATGATDHLHALRQALALRPEVIFFVTDADDLTPEQVRAATLLNQGRAAIHPVELRDGPPGRDDAPLRQLAQLNRGTYRLLPLR
jgi:hypothetical protein